MTHIEGLFRLSSPLHCAAPTESQGAKSDDQKQNVTRTVVQRVVWSGGITSIPYFPANDLKGRLRRKAGRMVVDFLVSQGARFSPDLYVSIMSGSPLHTIESTNTVGEIERARRDVYLGLFGGGARMLRSRVRASDILPVLPATIDIGAVPREYGDETSGGFLPKLRTSEGVVSAEGRALLQRFWFKRIDDVLKLVRPGDVMEAIEDPHNSIPAYQAQSVATKTARRGAKAGEADIQVKVQKSDAEMIYEIEAIAAGTPLYVHLGLAPDATDAHVGMLLLALRDLVREQGLGGKISHGFGNYIADLRLSHAGATCPVFAEPAGANATLSESVADLVAAAHEGIHALTFEGIRSFFTASGDE